MSLFEANVTRSLIVCMTQMPAVIHAKEFSEDLTLLPAGHSPNLLLLVGVGNEKQKNFVGVIKRGKPGATSAEMQCSRTHGLVQDAHAAKKGGGGGGSKMERRDERASTSPVLRLWTWCIISPPQPPIPFQQPFFQVWCGTLVTPKLPLSCLHVCLHSLNQRVNEVDYIRAWQVWKPPEEWDEVTVRYHDSSLLFLSTPSSHSSVFMG